MPDVARRLRASKLALAYMPETYLKAAIGADPAVVGIETSRIAALPLDVVSFDRLSDP